MGLYSSVVIVGAGPVGMTLALDLAQRGVDVTILEQRGRLERPTAKCNHISARTMEHFRRLGVADAIRNAPGLPADYNNDIAHRTRAVGGYEMARIHIPSRQDRFTDKAGPDGWWPTPEPPHRMNQIFLEPALFLCVEKHPNLRILNTKQFTGYREADGRVTVQFIDTASGRADEISCRFMVGCDGPRSQVRRAMGAKLIGDPVLSHCQSTLIRAPHLLGMIEHPPWFSIVLNRERAGLLGAIDGREVWIVTCNLRPDEDHESAEPYRDANLRTLLGLGADFQYETISIEDWTARRLVCDRFRNGSVFLCGDAAHVWVPMAGYGMNAGIADAGNLAWLMAAYLKGWAPIEILDSYELERHPITDQVSRFAMRQHEILGAVRASIPPNIEDSSELGVQQRAEFGKKLHDIDVPQYACAGLNFGYFYPDSPIIAYDGEEAPPYTMGEFTETTVPGCRTPHFWRADGRSVYDDFGDGYTLMRFDEAVDVQPLLACARARGVPMKFLDLPRSEAPAAYRHALVLSRPDRHVAWRSDQAPADPGALVDLIRGARTPADAAARPTPLCTEPR